MKYHNKKYTVNTKTFPYVETAVILEDELPSDILDDIGEGNARNTYETKVLVTKGKDINENTKIRMDNLRKQLKGFKYFEVRKQDE
jgi:hypothetical protein